MVPSYSSNLFACALEETAFIKIIKYFGIAKITVIKFDSEVTLKFEVAADFLKPQI